MVPQITKNTVSATWYDSSWTKCKVITISNPVAGYQMFINVTYDSDMLANFSDLRFMDSDNTTALSYWIEYSVASSYADVWVKLHDTDSTIVMYYGHTAIAPGSSGANTWNYFLDWSTDKTSLFHLRQSGTSDIRQTEWTALGLSYNLTATNGYRLMMYEAKTKLIEANTKAVGISSGLTAELNMTEIESLNWVKTSLNIKATNYYNHYIEGMKDGTGSNGGAKSYNMILDTYYTNMILSLSTSQSQKMYKTSSTGTLVVDGTRTTYIPVRNMTAFGYNSYFGGADGGYDNFWWYNSSAGAIQWGAYSTGRCTIKMQCKWVCIGKYATTQPTGSFGSELTYTPPNNPPTITNPVPMNSTTNISIFSPPIHIDIADPDGDLLEYWINVSENGYSHGTNVHNATFSTSVGTLDYGKTYKWWVNATDGTVWVRKWYQFTTEINDPPTFGTPSPTNGSTGNNLALTWSIPISDDQGETFNWTIQCNNSQTNSGNGASNGTKSLSLSGLIYSHTYKIWVNATDIGSKTYTRKWYTFTTKANSIPTVTFPTFVNGTTGVSRSINNVSFILIDGNGELMKCHGQSKSGDNLWWNNTGNGTKTFTFSKTYPPFPYSYNCTFWINVTDGYGWVNRSYWFVIIANVKPSFSNENPTNKTTGIDIDFPAGWLTVDITDPDESIEVWINTSTGEHGHNILTSGTHYAFCTLLDVPLDCDTNITWYVNATDGYDWTRAKYWFTTEHNYAPVISNEDPANSTTGINVCGPNIDINISDQNGQLMNWTIETNQSDKRNGSMYNGTIQCNLTTLPYDTKVKWWVNVTDGIAWTRKWFIFTTIENSPPDQMMEFPMNKTNNVQPSTWDYGVDNVSILISDPNIATEYDPLDIRLQTVTNPSSAFSMTSDDLYLYLGADEGIYKYWKSNMTFKERTDEDYFNAPVMLNYEITAIDNDDNYIFCAGSSYSEYWHIFWKSNLTYKATGTGCLGWIYSIVNDDTYVYLGGGSHIYKYYKSNFTKKTTLTLTDMSYKLLVDDTYLYYIDAGDEDKAHIRQLWKSNLTQKDCLTFNYPYDLFGGFAMDDTYLYVTNTTVGGDYYDGSITQYWKSNLTRKAQTPTIVHNNGFRSIVAENQTYIYAGSWTSQWWSLHDGAWYSMMNPLIYQYWKSNMTLKQTSNNGSTAGTEWLCEDDDYVYGIAVSGSGVAQYYKNGSGSITYNSTCYPLYWTIETSKGTSANGMVIGTTTVYCPVSTTFSENITWWVNVTDGTDWSNGTYWFTVLDNIPPIINNWQIPENESEGVNISTKNLTIIMMSPYHNHINYIFKLENTIVANITNFYVNGQTYLYGNITGLLQPMKKYNWSIAVFDGIDWTNETYWFITQMIYIDFNWTIRSNGLTVDFYSKNATSTVLYYIWDFGDAGMSNVHNPRHTYAFGPANYTVKLKVQDNATLYAYTATHIIKITVTTTVDNSIGKPLLGIDWTFILYLAIALLILLVVVLIVKGIGSIKNWMDKK